MDSVMDKVQPAVKKETRRVAMITGNRADPDVDCFRSATCGNASESSV